MKIGFLGDIHGRWRELSKAVRKCEEHETKLLVQLGDFGYYSKMGQIWPPKHLTIPFDIKVFFIDGNHEDHWRLRDNCSRTEPTQVCQFANILHWPRGYVMSIDGINILGIGGAESYGSRGILGRDWFQEESITYADLELALANCQGKTIDVVISHDCPDYFQVDEEFRQNAENFSAPSRKALEAIQDELNPKLWLFGHYHRSMRGEHESTIWQCLATNEVVFFDTSLGML